MATSKNSKTNKTTEFAQAADHLNSAAKEMRTAVGHQFSAVGEAMAARLNQAKKSAMKQRDDAQRGLSGLVKAAEAQLKKAETQLVKAGHAVSVWNRTSSKADPLARIGAEVVTDKAAMTTPATTQTNDETALAVSSRISTLASRTSARMIS